jgi:acetyltransferase-like isoleucine patch superfamily enzyme
LSTTFENASIGEGTRIEPDVCVGFRYHPDCGPACLGKDGILRKGTLIYGDVSIGDYFQSGHYAVIRARVKIGDYCTLSNHSTLEGIVRLGNGVRIMTNVYIPSRTWIGDHVFIGPGTTFLNDRLPGRTDAMANPVGATIEDDVMIGGAVTILPGITIGQRSFIAAGAVVTKDVPPRSLVVGVPGKIRPLPDDLDRINNRHLTQQSVDFWHPQTPDIAALNWPEDWLRREPELNIRAATIFAASTNDTL